MVGLHHLVFEVTDNVLDEFVNGHASTMTVTINGDGSITVVDDGRGIPVGKMVDLDNRSALEVVFTEIHAGGKFDRKAYATGTGGLHGVGLTAVNACSEWLEPEVRREGHVWTIEFARGEVVSELTKLGATDQTGTKITFKPDPQIFPNTTFSYDTIHKRLQDCAFLNAGVPFGSVNSVTFIVLASLIVGKIVGISLFSWGGVKAGFPLPTGMDIRHLAVAGLIAGLGLTVALFVAGKAFPGPPYLDPAKMGAVLSGGVAVLAVAAGYALKIKGADSRNGDR